ncbi:MAG: hypothetical protein ICV63_17200 [Coleofasciculus sp. Co-bin14]|nr:hypothetical protein [Coleofasciculus sp. Co-bin14]
MNKANLCLMLGLSISLIGLTSCGTKNLNQRPYSAHPIQKTKPASAKLNREQSQSLAQLKQNNQQSKERDNQQSKERERIYKPEKETALHTIDRVDWLICQNYSNPSSCIAYRQQLKRDEQENDLRRKKYLAKLRQRRESLVEQDELQQSSVQQEQRSREQRLATQLDRENQRLANQLNREQQQLARQIDREQQRLAERVNRAQQRSTTQLERELNRSTAQTNRELERLEAQTERRRR